MLKRYHILRLQLGRFALASCLFLLGASPRGLAVDATEFETATDLQIDRVIGEPEVRQPVHISFDERGRL